MKVIKSENYRTLFSYAQQVYDPDEREFDDLNEENYEFIDEGDEGLPEIGPEDIGETVPIEDDSDLIEEGEEAVTEEVKPIDADQAAYPDFESATQAMQYAIKEREAVRITYYKRKEGTIIRDVEPHGMFKAKTTGNIILVTWNRDMNYYSAFIVGNISNYEWIGENFELKFNFRQERNRMLGRLRQRKHRRIKTRRQESGRLL